METNSLRGKYYLEKEKGKRISPDGRKREAFKVKYISSPVTVNAKTAAEFRAIVQELTGKTHTPNRLNIGNGHHESPIIFNGATEKIKPSHNNNNNNNKGVVDKLHGSKSFTTLDDDNYDEDFWLQELSKCPSEIFR